MSEALEDPPEYSEIAFFFAIALNQLHLNLQFVPSIAEFSPPIDLSTLEWPQEVRQSTSPSTTIFVVQQLLHQQHELVSRGGRTRGRMTDGRPSPGTCTHADPQKQSNV